MKKLALISVCVLGLAIAGSAMGADPVKPAKKTKRCNCKRAFLKVDTYSFD